MPLVAIALAAGLGVVAGTVPFVPAAYLQGPIERATDGRVVVSDAQGTLWYGGMRLGFASGGRTEQRRSSLLPAPIRWRLSGIGVAPPSVSFTVASAGVLESPVEVAVSTAGSHLDAGRARLPAEILEAAGAPLNTLRPGGLVTLSWDTLDWRSSAASSPSRGTITLDWIDARSALSPVAPLGAYRVRAQIDRETTGIDLSTRAGPLLLSGTGTWTPKGGLQFHGEARSEAGRETELNPLLGLLGPVRNGAAQLRIGT